MLAKFLFGFGFFSFIFFLFSTMILGEIDGCMAMQLFASIICIFAGVILFAEEEDDESI